eukprot:2667137-Amphidinium_carterae.1
MLPSALSLGVPPGVAQPIPGKVSVDVARSTSPCARHLTAAPPVPQFGDGASIFTAQRGRSPPRAPSMAKLGQDDLPAHLTSHRDDPSVHSNIVRIASVPPYLRHYDGADDGTLLRRMVNIGPFAQNLLLEEMRTHLLDKKMVPLDAEVHSRARYTRHALVACRTEEDARLVKEQFRLAKPRHLGMVLYANQILTKSQAKKGWQLREARRGLLAGLPQHLQQQVELCYKSGLVYVNREVATYFRGDDVYLGPGFPVTRSAGNTPPPLPAWRHKRAFRFTIGPEFPLPSIGAWNARALFHHDANQAGKKYGVLDRLMRSCDIVFACETHRPLPHHLELFRKRDKAKRPRLHVSLGSVASAGGILCAYCPKQGETSRCFELIPGRAIVLQVCRGVHERYFIGCHLHSPDDWSGMVQLIHEFCLSHPEALHVIIGDLNFIPDSADMVDRSTGVTGRALGQVGARHHTWHRYFADWTEIVLGFTHIHASGKHMSAIDRCFVNLPCSMVAMLAPRPIVIGLPEKVPGGSDHCPISVKFGSSGVSDSQLPKWVAHHKSWVEVVRLAQVQDAIESAATEIMQANSHYNIEDPFVLHCVLLLIVRASLRHDRVALEAIERRCPTLHWLNPTQCVATGRVASDDSSSHTRAQWVSLCLARWKKSQFLSEPAVASCVDPEMEVLALRRYWQEVFNRQAEIDAVVAEHILPHTPMLPWDRLDLSRAQFISFIGKAPRTAAGPDGVTYDMLRALATPVGAIFEDMMAGMALGQPIPVHFSDSLTVFVAKKQDPIPAAVLARQLSSFSDWVHPQQYGFTPGRDTADEQCIRSALRCLLILLKRLPPEMRALHFFGALGF